MIKLNLIKPYSFVLVDDDKELEKIREECVNGELMCGHCKVHAAELMKDFFEDLKNSKEVDLEVFQNRPFIKKWAESVARLFSPIL